MNFEMEQLIGKVKDQNEQVFINGRFVKRSQFGLMDLFSEQIKLAFDERVQIKFAFLPTETSSGRVWMKFYYSYSRKLWGDFVDDGPSWETLARSVNLDELKTHIKVSQQNNLFLFGKRSLQKLSYKL